jgi:hypothetical protein
MGREARLDLPPVTRARIRARATYLRTLGPSPSLGMHVSRFYTKQEDGTYKPSKGYTLFQFRNAWKAALTEENKRARKRLAARQRTTQAA